jgi:adenylosuccinate lyase
VWSNTAKGDLALNDCFTSAAADAPQEHHLSLFSHKSHERFMTGHDRYTTAYMRSLWSDERTLHLWREIEIAVLEAQVAVLEWPAGRLDPARETPEPEVSEWAAAAEETGHEFVAFLQAWNVPWVHIGLTSSDVIDTALALRLRQAGRELHRLLLLLRSQLQAKAQEHRSTARLARTHGQPATRTVLGLRFADFANAVDRSAARLYAATRDVSMGKLSGPVGTYANISPQVEERALASLGLEAAPSATQIVSRDSLLAWVSAVAGAMQVCEAVATEVRLSSHHQIAEMAEGAPANQRGSSAMPHKRNPIRCERITGLSRLARSMVEPVAAGVSQWHERDLAHSSVERVVLPQLCGIAAYGIALTVEVVRDLQVNEYRMLLNIKEHEVEIATHDAQVALQLQGLTHGEAQLEVREAYRVEHNVNRFLLRLGLHPDVVSAPDVDQQIRDALRLGFGIRDER